MMPLDGTHDRTLFNSGSEPLDLYLRHGVGQDIRRRVASCFVAAATDGKVAGYYTLASCGIPLHDLPLETARKLPRYPMVPATRMGRLAVCRSHQGKGLGGALLMDACKRIHRNEIASCALLVDAKDSAAKNFYVHHGFIELIPRPMTLILPAASYQRLLQ
ncbi:GNAT family N-acetyltransferase [Cupriavidus sp. AU9028]|uniref:GNAT family N-acetyltransferase n=1 Tax=Cupriavidus sp. AU9028 TaxID=2871157 RepID=UPI00351D2A6D